MLTGKSDLGNIILNSRKKTLIPFMALPVHTAFALLLFLTVSFLLLVIFGTSVIAGKVENCMDHY